MLATVGIIVLILGLMLLFYGFVDENKKVKIVSISVIVIGLILLALHFNTESGKRAIKSINSDMKGGIERTVEVYDQQGNLIKKYTGKFDVETNEYGNKVLFDLNGKRTIIYNATVIVQEE